MVSVYPAHLHIDLLPVLQGKGVGRAMMARLLDELRARECRESISASAPATSAPSASIEHLGFEHLDETDDVLMGIRLGKT